MQDCSKTQDFPQNSTKKFQKSQFSGKSTTLHLPENHQKKAWIREGKKSQEEEFQPKGL